MTERAPSPHVASPSPAAGETPDAWTDRLAREGAALGIRRQCSIGWHGECSARLAGPSAGCRCACHDEQAVPPLWEGIDRNDGEHVEAVPYGDQVHLELGEVSLLALDPTDAAALGVALIAWAGEHP